jgi:hypothetical protein
LPLEAWEVDRVRDLIEAGHYSLLKPQKPPSYLRTAKHRGTTSIDPQIGREPTRFALTGEPAGPYALR